MSEIAIRAQNLSKVYRLYSRHRYRLLDVLGLLPRGAGAYREHKALDAVSIDISRGEKVAIIGRNGAGKSTFMKLVSRVIQPTSGVLDVRARVNALLQIGTGFHPDFTGRENVYAYLAQLGVAGAAANKLFDDVVEFAELEEYIDQPVKTYSTGMGVRLMFSTSTAIDPDLLLLDEVLGVGDAYFAQKSFDRIRQLCSSHGTTLLLVTHDVYAASRLCERMIWIDRGQVVLDGAGPDVIRAYEDSVRVQEEHRLRTRRLSAMRALGGGGASTGGVMPLLVEVAAANNAPQSSPVYFSAIEIRRNGGVVAALPLTSARGEGDASTLQEEAAAWGAPVTWQGVPSRAMLNYGSPFHRVAGVLALPPASDRAGLEVRLRYWADRSCDLRLRMYSGAWAADLGRLPDTTGSWVEHTVAVHPETDEDPAVVPNANVVGRYGTGDIQIVDAGFVERDDRPAEVLRHGEAVTLRLRDHVRRPLLRERAQVIIVMHRDGVQDVCRVIARDLLFDANAPQGEVRLTLPRLALTDGRYTVTVMVADEGYYDRRQTTFFTINPGVYSCLSRAFEVKVIGAGFIGEGTVVVEQGDWASVATPQV